MGRILSVVSGKGGVGNTVTALNLAASLNNKGKEVLLVDGNLSNPEIYTYLGAKDLQCSFHDVLQNKTHFSNLVHEHSSGLKVVPSTPRSEIFSDRKTFRDKIFDMKNHSDFLIIDSAAGLSHESIAAIESSQTLLLVTTPEETAVESLKKVLAVATDLKKEVLGVVVNQVGLHKHEVSESEISQVLQVPVIEKVPFDLKVKHSHKLKHPVVHSHPTSKSSKRFERITTRFI